MPVRLLILLLLPVLVVTGSRSTAEAAVSAVPAASYWLARKTWMPELTRFAWLVWIVVGFAFTYGNYLNTLSRA